MSRPPFDPHTDYYALLGVAPSATASEVQSAYRRLAKTYHPDLHAGSSVAEARMARLNRAKAILLDPDVRRAYDDARGHRLTAASSPRPATQPSAWSAPRSPRSAVARAAAAPRPSPQPVAPRPSLGWAADRTTLLVLAAAIPLVMGVVWYLAAGLEMAGKPRGTYPSDLALSAVSPRSTQAVAASAFSMVAGKPPNRRDATNAVRIIDTLRDFSPEASVLRAIGRRLLRAAETGDEQLWTESVVQLCAMADHCGPPSAPAATLTPS